MAATDTITVTIAGKGPVKLCAGDHVQTGGEGSVYRKGALVFKVYTDPKRMARDGTADKVLLLKQVKHPFIVAPADVLLDANGAPVGFTMPWVEGIPLPKVFTTDWRLREGFDDAAALRLADGMHQAVGVVHSVGALMVDGNEMNYLVAGTEPRVIDVDSWQIGRFPATAIMPSIRDHHSATFSDLTDWFSWGVVSFQVFTGIHPYKGRHPSFRPGDLEGRMRANVSVFDPEVKLASAVRSFDCIPAPLRDWYRATFQAGERSIPPLPSSMGAAPRNVPVVMRVSIAATTGGSLVFEKLLEAETEIARAFTCGVVELVDGRLVNVATKAVVAHGARGYEVVPFAGGHLMAGVKDGRVDLLHACAGQTTPVPLPLAARSVFRSGSRLFTVSDRGLTEITIHMVGKAVVAAPGRTWDVLVNATAFLDGVAVSDVLGAAYLVYPFGEASCAMLRVRELDGLRPFAGFGSGAFACVVGLDKAGQYQKVEISLTADGSQYRAWVGQTDQPDINAAVTARGVVATIVSDGELVLFPSTGGAAKKISDRNVTADMRLFQLGGGVGFVKGREVWRLSMGGK